MGAKILGGCCGHYDDDHEFLGVWSDALFAQYGSPCNICKSYPEQAADVRARHGLFCRGFFEWKIDNIPPPGSFIAVELGCRCPIEVNYRRRIERIRPVYTPGCPIHDWVCKLTKGCTHTIEQTDLVLDFLPAAVERNHARVHERCEHCTVPQIECEICGRVWGDWRTTAEQSGWWKVHEETENLKPVWRCDTCRSK